ncbi:unnamed protein product [Rotaria sp. Silwood1]|nr:unnamed protein product [Rotaria sp. Silwood1]CAF3329196.1 unnamed protein product [Rotaria sp. Silwood1]CAF3348479.1 unnamed protein product [Rotaria sp. Silwood1]CAF3356690.1 unnamed protein product [Rotaria sp. Silwood1]CAF4579221.1 unnamed protein product [Rotaria sp. Silwood1]
MFFGRMLDSLMLGESSRKILSTSYLTSSPKSSGLITPLSHTSLNSTITYDRSQMVKSHLILRNHFLNGKNHFIDKYNHKQVDNAILNDFIIQRRVGGGSFGTVVLATDRKKQIAMKILEKQHIVKLKQIRHVINECHLLGAIKCPFIVDLLYKFKDNANLYLCLEFIGGGEMFHHMRKQKNKRFSENLALFYAAQITLAFEYLQYLDICHRDLKPENCLITYDGFIKLTDFGFAKVVPGRTYTFCGTAQYLAPEILSNKGYGKGVDWWCLGIFLYELNAGFSPFYALDHATLYSLILRCEYKFPKHFKEDLKSLIRKLLQIDITKRYGCLANGAQDIKNHIYFQKINWLSLYEKKVQSEFRPQLIKGYEFEYFEEKKDFIISKSSICLFEKEFQDF